MEYIYVEDYGCTANQNYTEIIEGLLSQQGFFCLHNLEEAKKLSKIALINTCIVKGPTLQKMKERIKQLLLEFDYLIVTGCMMEVFADEIIKIKEEIKREKKLEKHLGMISLFSLNKLPSLLRIIKEKEIMIEKKVPSFLPLCKQKRKKNKLIGITQIASGCVGNCSYCIVKRVKGNLFSFPPSLILKNIERDLLGGAKEIWLTSQDNACYGFDKKEGILLPELIEKIVSIRGSFFIRIGMMNPSSLKRIFDKFLDSFDNPKIFKFLHLPLQSGSDRILKKMYRGYSSHEFVSMIYKFRERFPFLQLSTDVIVGFPGEEDKDFEKTIKVIEKTKPEIINISKFWPMPFTKAKEMWEREKTEEKKIKERTKLLMEVKKQILEEKRKEMVGKEFYAVVDSDACRDENFRLVFLNTPNNFGKIVKIKITKSSPFLKGKIIKKRVSLEKQKIKK